MNNHREKLFLPYRQEDLFDLVADIESYPDFVPGWQKVRVQERGSDCLRVEQQIGLGLVQLRFTSQATLNRPLSIHIESNGRPFRELRVDWSFTPRDGGCLVEFSSSLQLAAMQTLSTALLEIMGSSIINAFKQRAASRLPALDEPREFSGEAPKG